MRIMLALAAGLALAAPAPAHAAGELFTLAGVGTGRPADGPLRDGMSALRAALPGSLPVAGAADGTVLVSTRDTIWRVDAQGRLDRVAGTGELGYTGDGGPATRAEISADAVAALPGGGFLFADPDNQRIRRVDAGGTITTVAGGGTSRADGVPATRAALRQPGQMAALPGGGFLLVDAGTRLREVGPDGLIRTIAGGGDRDERANGQPATSLKLLIGSAAAAPDGSVLLTAYDAIDRLTPDGRLTTVLSGHGLAPAFITALPDGGYAFVDDRTNPRTLDERVRIVRVAPDGRTTVLVGGGPFAAVAPLGLDARLDGRPATAFATSPPGGIAAAADGGLLFSYDIDNGGNESPGGAIGYVAPAVPAILGAALRRDGARVFAPGRAGAVHVVLTLPATVTLTVAGRTVTRTLPAGVSRVPLRRDGARPDGGAGGRRRRRAEGVRPHARLPPGLAADRDRAPRGRLADAGRGGRGLPALRRHPRGLPGGRRPELPHGVRALRGRAAALGRVRGLHGPRAAALPPRAAHAAPARLALPAARPLPPGALRARERNPRHPGRLMRFAMTLAAALIVFSGPHHGESLRGFAGSVGPGGRTPAHPHAFWAFARGSGIACSVRAHEVVCAGRGAAVRMNDVGAVRRCHCPQPHATRLLRWGHGMTAGLLGCDVTGVVRCQFADGAGFELSRSGRLKILNPPPVESRAAAPAPGALFTLAGAGTDDEALGEGLPAAVAPLEDPSSLAALPDGSFLAGSEGAVWRVTPQGRLQRVAGQREREGYTGDGGPALAAEVAPDHLAAVPSGGFLLADQGDQRVRMVAADGTITTVAGGGTSKADGVPALRAALGEPLAIAALPGGGFAIDDGETRVREVAPDGSIRTVAGGGQDDRIHGEPATAADLQVWDIAAEPDGTLLLVDGRNQAIDRVARDGTIHVAARPPRADGVEPTAVTALPDGGFAFAATVADDFGAGSTRVYRVGPDGIVRPVAGGGPFAPAPLAGLTRRGDGGAATAQPLARAVELSALPDGGLLLSTDATSFGADGDVVTYIAPDAPAVLAVAMRRDGARVFRPGRPNAVHVALTLPATLTLRSGGRSVTRALPAGQSTVALPGPLSPRPHAVTLAAVDSAGRGAYDHAAVFPAGWLPEETARIVADAVAPERVATICKRFAGGRIDCQDDSEADPCVTISIRYARERVRWGTYRGCEPRAHPRYSRPPRPLGRRDWHCEPTDEQCEPALLGRVREADIVPQS